MLTNDSVTIDFLWDYLFPFPVYFGPVDHTGILGPEESGGSLRIWPNPATKMIRITSPEGYAKEIVIADISGRQLVHRSSSPPMDAVDISTLAPGRYFIRIVTNQNHIQHGTFEKMR
ncbi:MAG: T9SS type A sorting domain-containing protein [Flavobacteriales bacterium]|nr:T9SS type A sorting domain-containing protein [Flavobacteriales bacterium]MBK6894327.1 T9SS type A sorting domain-containing protein [Flavobacteriales bacterium]MBK7248257.1 T9SS type A sorting domain-containing protein [Flavobacteriales bacterium]MBK7287390.1 T9SS type A sorting domain-containing protein [Flavobacteriales bacterium]MBK9059551.1 T9SS type A sorting domain-containing protein [Flavobacteriales bacterium]